ncbi:MAG: enoyl-CoA hydratase-related protein, partial [Actinomycetota bacterium]|nr:enoyl-CoA hydratase-related protein [Actinomycetota bacterium]
MANYETLVVEERDRVAWVTLNRPEAHNAFTALMQEECRNLWRSLRTNDEVRVVVLTGAGEQAFCVGIDRNEPFTALGDSSSLYGTSNNFMYDDPGDWLGPKSNDLWKPV